MAFDDLYRGRASIVYSINDVGSTGRKDYLKNQSTYNTVVEDNYVDPTAYHAPEQKRNLIYLYLESMESTYADKAPAEHSIKLYPELSRPSLPQTTSVFPIELLGGGQPTVNAT